MQGNETGWSCSSDLYTMNQLCKVCGEPAAGFHFGAFTCEGCKSFFGRTYNNLSSLSECKNSGRCVINKKNRTSCKSCRLRKCLMVGMSKSGSRYGRRSNWFKIHCLLQDQAHMNGQLDPTMGGNGELTPQQLGYASKGEEEEEEDCKDDLLLTGSPDSRSDYCGGDRGPKSPSNNGLYDGKAKSGSLSPLSPYASPSPPYDKKENYTLHAMPVSPLSPMSPLAALHHQQKFFGHAAAAAAAAGFLHQNCFGSAYHHHAHHRLAASGDVSGAGVGPGVGIGGPHPHHLHMLGAGAAPGPMREHAPHMAAFRPYHAAPLDLLSRKRKSSFVIEMPSGGVGQQDKPMDLSVKRKAAASDDDECRPQVKRDCRNVAAEGAASAEPRSVESPLDLTKRP